jgi:hypothetical protein
MSGAAAASTAAIIAANAESFKKYLITCEYLQIDPTKVYDLDFIKTRIETVRVHWTKSDEIKQVAKLNKSLKWFEKNYLRLAKKGFWSYGFANQCEKHIQKGRLKIHEGSVNDTYILSKLTQNNYDFYSRNDKKHAFIVLGIFLIIILSVALVILLL